MSLLSLKKYLGYHKEVGGSLDENTLELRRIREEDGSGSMDLTLSPVSFHTHPLIYYQMNKCVYGWPSDRDIISVYEMRDDVKIHYVITKEGVYTIKVHPGGDRKDERQIEKFLQEIARTSKERMQEDGLQRYLLQIKQLLKGNKELQINFQTWDELGEKPKHYIKDSDGEPKFSAKPYRGKPSHSAKIRGEAAG